MYVALKSDLPDKINLKFFALEQEFFDAFTNYIVTDAGVVLGKGVCFRLKYIEDIKINNTEYMLCVISRCPPNLYGSVIQSALTFAQLISILSALNMVSIGEDIIFLVRKDDELVSVRMDEWLDHIVKQHKYELKYIK